MQLRTVRDLKINNYVICTLHCGIPTRTNITNKMSFLVGRGATKHCCWGLCKSDSRYTEKIPPGTVFINFPKLGKIKDSMTEWEKRTSNA